MPDRLTPAKIVAPWTPAEVDALNAYQQSGRFHPYTCRECPASLTATPDGWVCMDPTCESHTKWRRGRHYCAEFPTVQQTWAHASSLTIAEDADA